MLITIIDHRLFAFAVALWFCGTDVCVAVEPPAEHGLKFTEDEATGRFTIVEATAPVLTYNFGTVTVPPGVTGQYAVARSDYVHPLYGPDGEVLTKDFSPDHPHHRGIYWAWPEVTWKGEKRDLHALQGVFARPVRMIRKEVAGDSAVIEAENVWKWGDAEPIVKELATITVWSEKERRRVIDFEFRLEALSEGVTLARRDQDKYGGLNVRLSALSDQKIVTHIGRAEQKPRQAWAAVTGLPPEGTHLVTVVLLQAPTNPEYPGDWVQYPELNWLQPTFPSKGTAFSLMRGAPLTLRFRVAVLTGDADEALLERLWKDYTESNK